MNHKQHRQIAINLKTRITKAKNASKNIYPLAAKLDALRDIKIMREELRLHTLHYFTLVLDED